MAARNLYREADLRQAGFLYRHHYPYGPDVCVYCGDPASTMDHVTPIVAVAAMQNSIDVREHFRHGLYIVPCCRDCNNRIGSYLARSITEKREEIKRRLRRKHARLLGGYEWEPEELDELGHSLRSSIQGSEAKRRRIRAGLAFPQPWEATLLRRTHGCR